MADASDPIGLANAMDDPDARQRLELIVGLWRAALSPWLNSEADNLSMNQSYMISAAALFAGMTVGHMTAVGTMEPRDHKRAERVVLSNFRNGIRFGTAEAEEAIKEAGTQ